METTAVLKQPVAPNVWVIVAVPALIPETVVEPSAPATVATAVLLLLHGPIPADESTVVAPSHKDDEPVTSPGTASTVKTVSAKQPDACVYLIEVVPADTVLIMPVDAPTVATPVLTLDHVPPAGDEDNDRLVPRHVLVVPVMADGVIFTVTTAVLKQPVAANVCVTTAVPADTPVAVVVPAVPETVTTEVLLLPHGPVPLETSVVFAPSQTLSVPVTLSGLASTVTTCCTKQPPGTV